MGCVSFMGGLKGRSSPHDFYLFLSTRHLILKLSFSQISSWLPPAAAPPSLFLEM